MNAATKQLILASTSPRRRQLLSEWGYKHLPTNPPIDDGELVPGSVSSAAWVASLAFLKARAVWDNLNPELQSHSLVLAADTVVQQDGRIMGQPKDASDAQRIVATLTGATHKVLTGVCICAQAERVWFVDCSTVEVGEVGAEDITSYVDSGQWAGKAGGYNLHERIDAGWPIQFTGDDTSIMGLPMQRLAPELERLGIRAHSRDRAEEAAS